MKEKLWKLNYEREKLVPKYWHIYTPSIAGLRFRIK